MHGNNDYVGRYAFLAKILSENGYDVVGCDRRGYGFSEGERGYLISTESVRDDMLAYS